jgi:hypothetical protein
MGTVKAVAELFEGRHSAKSSSFACAGIFGFELSLRDLVEMICQTHAGKEQVVQVHWDEGIARHLNLRGWVSRVHTTAQGDGDLYRMTSAADLCPDSECLRPTSRKRHARDPARGVARQCCADVRHCAASAGDCRFHRTLSRNLRRTDAEHPHRRPDRRRFRCRRVGRRAPRTRVLSRANSPPAAWSSAAHRAISKSTACYGHPTISQPTIASRWL